MSNSTSTNENRAKYTLHHRSGGAWELLKWERYTEKQKKDWGMEGGYSFFRAYADLSEAIGDITSLGLFSLDKGLLEAFHKAGQRVREAISERTPIDFKIDGRSRRLQLSGCTWELLTPKSRKGRSTSYEFEKGYSEAYLGGRILSLFIGDLSSSNPEDFIKAFNEASEKACAALYGVMQVPQATGQTI